MIVSGLASGLVSGLTSGRAWGLAAALWVSAGCVQRGSEPPPPEPEPVVRHARLIFAGDVMAHAPQIAAARAASAAHTAHAAAATEAGNLTEYNFDEVFRYFRPVFEDVDIAVANLETTLRTAPPYTGYPRFAAPAELAGALRRAGIDIVTTANNHILDRGAEGLRTTLAVLDSAGLMHTGAFRDSADRRARHPLRFTAGGMRFALLAYTYGTNGMPVSAGIIVNQIDTAVIGRDLALVREGGESGASGVGGGDGAGPGGSAGPADVVIVSYHWGEEYRSMPTRQQRRLAEWTRARGADIIIGHHPHVVQPIEPYLTSSGSGHIEASGNSPSAFRPTYFSLGNFVSNQRWRRSDGGIVAEIAVSRVDSLPVTYVPGWRLAWVHTTWRDGARHYTVLPVGAIDTLTGPDASAARTFAADTRKLLASDSLIVKELK